MSEYIRCPYCGEEILAVAKKCKYCKEWLTEHPEGITNVTETAIPTREDAIIEPKIVTEDNGETSWRNQSQEKDVYFKAQEPGFMEKLNPTKWLLDEFIIKNGVMTVSTKKGTSLSAPIKEVVVGYTNTNVGKAYTFKYGGKKLTISEMPNMLSDDEWESLRKIVESFPNYGLSSLGAIVTAFEIVGVLLLLIIIAFWLI